MRVAERGEGGASEVEYVREGNIFSGSGHGEEGVGSATTVSGAAAVAVAALGSLAAESSAAISPDSAAPAGQSGLASLLPGKEYDLKFSVGLMRGSAKGQVYCPQYHRSKVASYWCVVGWKGEILSVKKIILSGPSMNVSIRVRMPGGMSAVPMTPATENKKILSPNDKLYLNYDDEYRKAQEQNEINEKNQQNQRKQLKSALREQEKIRIYLVSDSIMGLDDFIELPFLSI